MSKETTCKLCNRSIRPGATVKRLESGVLGADNDFVPGSGAGEVVHSSCFQRNFTNPKTTMSEIKKIAEQRAPAIAKKPAKKSATR